MNKYELFKVGDKIVDLGIGYLVDEIIEIDFSKAFPIRTKNGKCYTICGSTVISGGYPVIIKEEYFGKFIFKMVPNE